MFSCNLPPALLVEDQDLLRAAAVTQGVRTDTEIRVSTES